MRTLPFLKPLSTRISCAIAALLTLAVAFTSCKDDEFYLKNSPELSVSANSFTLSKDAGSISFDIASNRQWTITDEATYNDPDDPWYQITPASKKGENNATVTVYVRANNATTRTLKLTVAMATKSEQVIITQEGTVEAKTLYADNFGTTASQNPNWPLVSEYTGWAITGEGASAVAYTAEGTVSVRNNSSSSGYTGASGACNVMMAAAGASFIVNNIDPLGLTTMNLTFGSNETSTTLKLFFSTDGTNWTDVTYEKTTTAWGLVTASFGIPEGSSALYLKYTAATTQYGTRIDDIQLVGEGGSVPSGNLSISPSSISPTAAGGSYTISVTSTTDWTVTPDAANPWCTVAPLSGSSNGTLTVTVPANTGSARTASIVVATTDGAASKTLTVAQAGVSTGNDGSHDKPFNVSEAMSNQGAVGNTDYFWVKGYIVGVVETGSTNTASFTAPFTNQTNLLIAASAGETSWNNCLSVQLPSGTVRTDLNLNQHPENKGKEVMLEGTLEAYFSKPGLKNTRSYEWVSSTGSTLNLSTNALPVPSAQGSQTVTVTSNTSWAVTKDAAATWCTVTPTSGNNNGTLKIDYVNNPGSARSATITVKTADNAVTQTLVVTQNADIGNAIWVENVGDGDGKTAAPWTLASAYTGWQKAGSGSGSINYAVTQGAGTTTIDIRTNLSSAGSYVGASGSANIFFPAAGGDAFTASNINIGSATGLVLSFGLSYSSEYMQVAYSTNGGTSWDPLSYSKTSTSWGLTSASFTVPSGTSVIAIKFTSVAYNYGVRIDDINLSPGNVTPPVNPTVTTTDASNVGETTATVGGSYAAGSDAVTQVGVEYKTGAGAYAVQAAPAVATPFTVALTGLTTAAVYTYRAYAKTNAGTFYGTEKTFTTLSDYNLSVSPSSLTFAATPAGAQTVTVTSNTSWTVSIPSSDTWCTASALSGSNNGTVAITATPNTGSARSTTVTFTATGIPARTVVVSQDAGSSGETVYLEQDFSGCSGGSGFPSAGTSEITDLSTKGLVDWTGSKVYEAAGAVKMGTSSISGWIQTPPLTAISGTIDVVVTFKAGVWTSDPTNIGIEIIGAGKIGDSTTATIDGLNSTAMQEKSVTVTGVTSVTQIKFTGLVGKNRFFIDDVKVVKSN